MTIKFHAHSKQELNCGYNGKIFCFLPASIKIPTTKSMFLRKYSRNNEKLVTNRDSFTNWMNNGTMKPIV
jgi:hypothetical protein